jgi:hypothetical protein
MIALAVGLCFSGAAQAATVSWNGQNWDDDYASPDSVVSVVGSNLEVSIAPSGDWAAAHYNTNVAFRSAATPWIEVSFLDTANNDVRKGLWIEDENGASPGAGGWLQFEIRDNSGTYKILYNDYDADNLDGGGLNFSAAQVLDTGVARTAAEHTFKVGRRADGTVDFWVDGSLTNSLTSAQFNPNFFGDVYLSARGETAVYTQFAVGTNYVVPEPGSLALALLAGLGLFVAVRRRKA